MPNGHVSQVSSSNEILIRGPQGKMLGWPDCVPALLVCKAQVSERMFLVCESDSLHVCMRPVLELV